MSHVGFAGLARPEYRNIESLAGISVALLVAVSPGAGAAGEKEVPMKIPRSPVAALVVACSLLVARPVLAHCDTADGPVCLLYTSDAADDLKRVDLGGRRIIKKKKKKKIH